MGMTFEEAKDSDVAALTVAQVAEIMGVDRRTVSRAVQDGTVPSVKFGRRILIPREPFIRMLTVNDDQE